MWSKPELLKIVTSGASNGCEQTDYGEVLTQQNFSMKMFLYTCGCCSQFFIKGDI